MMKRIRIKSKKYFTLLEIMVVIIIITIASSAIGIRICKSISTYEYQKATDQIFEKLKFAKKFALANQCDIYISFKQDKSRLISEMGYYGEKDSHNRSYRHGFSNLRFKFISNDENIYENLLTLIFTSTGDYLPKGILYLFGSNKSLHEDPKTIDFKDFFLRESKSL